MRHVEGNIVDINARSIYKARIYYTNTIHKIVKDSTIQSDLYILPGFIDAHVHIESTMCTPVNYAEQAFKHGVVAAVTDPHEIANVCGISGVEYMAKNALETPLKILIGAPSCVPSTSFEISGGEISSDEIEYLFKNKICTHLSEMMNFPGLLSGDKSVLDKIDIAKKYNYEIDGHAPLLSGDDLIKYYNAGVTTDHECTSIIEAEEKINIGFKIMIRKSSASNDFNNLFPLIEKYPESLMLCTDDCHPDDLVKGYINDMVKYLINKNYSIFDIINVSVVNAKKHFNLDVGLLQTDDSADFIIVDDIFNFNIQQTVINGETVFDAKSDMSLGINKAEYINNFFVNKITLQNIQVINATNRYKVIHLIENSLITNYFIDELSKQDKFIESNTKKDILKIVVINRYQVADPSVAFIHGFSLKKGAIATTVSHDSHNIVALGENDHDIIEAISNVQEMKGGMVYVNGNEIHSLPLPVAGLMSDKNASQVANKYAEITNKVKLNGCTLHAPFMSLSFMSLLVIPKLKISDKGLFDGENFKFTDLQI